MLFMTTYKIKPFLSREETKKLLEVFAKRGPRTRHNRALRGCGQQPRRGDRRYR